MKIRCIAIDDEPLALELISEFIEQIPDLELLATFYNPKLARSFIETNVVDIVFLDINMPDISGLDLSKQFPSETKIIFTTAHEQYAVHGYQVESLGYILKPFNLSELDSALDRARAYFKEANEGKHFYVNSEHKKVRVEMSKIVLIENIKDYVRFHMKNGNKIMSLMSLKSVVELLDENQFLQIHRSYVVNLSEIDRYEKDSLKIGDKNVPVSRKYKLELKKKMS